jgi:hypothetical protein
MEIDEIKSFLNNSKEADSLLSNIRELIQLERFTHEQFTITIYSRPEIQLKRIKRMIICVCDNINRYMRNNQPVTIYLYLSDVLKTVDNSASGIYRSNINSGYYTYSRKGASICIFRFSELARVLTHELIHYLRIFRAPRLLEAQTEALAEYIYYRGADKYADIARKSMKIVAIICKIYKIDIDSIKVFGDFEKINPQIMRDSNILYYALYKLPIYSGLIANGGDYSGILRVDPRKVAFPQEYRELVRREMRVNKEVYSLTIL